MNRRLQTFPRHLVVVTSNYPSTTHPTNGSFVRQFAHAVARQGVNCTVIQPVAVHHAWIEGGYPSCEQEKTGLGCSVNVFRPRFLSLSSRSVFNNLRLLSPSLFSLSQFTAAVRRVLRTHSLHPDFLYGHFLYFAGAAVACIGREMSIPAFPGVGESVSAGKKMWTLAKFPQEITKKLFSDIPGIIVNSTLLKKLVPDQIANPTVSIEVFPNGIDPTIFYARDKVLMRKKFNLPKESFLVVCNGMYSHRKGQQRVVEAITELDNVCGVFIGGGVPNSSSSNICFNKQINHEEVPELLSACDVFVLPTLEEGCCNSIVEAMACGLPIVSSIGEFNDDLLDNEMSIRIDPLDIPSIRQAIENLRDNDEYRKKMSQASLRRSRSFDINDRARRILSFMEMKRSCLKC